MHPHEHDHEHGSGHGHDGSRNIRIAFFLNFGFTLLEIVGGLLTNSLAILSDALHDLGDSVSLALSWYFEKVSRRTRTSTLTFGYRRYSLLGALINAVILLFGSLLILQEAIPDCSAPSRSNRWACLPWRSRASRSTASPSFASGEADG